MWTRSLFTFLGSAMLCLIVRPAPALAVPQYPRNIIDYFTPHLGYTPPCRLCHIDGTTGPGSVQTPFGISMLSHGLTGDRNTLAPALDALKADNVDSDGDGVSDIDELIANTDPNTKADVSLSSSDPSYGCTVASGHGGHMPSAALETAVLAALVFLRRRPPLRSPPTQSGSTGNGEPDSRTKPDELGISYEPPYGTSSTQVISPAPRTLQVDTPHRVVAAQAHEIVPVQAVGIDLHV